MWGRNEVVALGYLWLFLACLAQVVWGFCTCYFVATV